MFAPLRYTEPDPVGSRPTIVLARVVFPIPLRPSNTTRSPAWTLTSTPLSTLLLLYPEMRRSSLSMGMPSEVDVPHNRVAFDLFHRPLPQHCALMDHGDLTLESADEAHVVFDRCGRAGSGDLLREPGP